MVNLCAIAHITEKGVGSGSGKGVGSNFSQLIRQIEIDWYGAALHDQGFHSGADSNVILAGGACENDVFWAPEGATTIGANATFIGNIFRGTADGLSITFGDSSTLTGRALAFGSTVTTANTTFSAPDSCAEPATITVNVDFIPDSLTTVSVALICTSGTATASPLDASEAMPAVFTVTGASAGATCTATVAVPIGYTASQGDCIDVALGGSCEIINTVKFRDIPTLGLAGKAILVLLLLGVALVGVQRFA